MSARPARVASCHDEAVVAQVGAGSPAVALVGNPNVGKSTFFNAVTGSARDVGNWPGTTVAVGRAVWVHGALGEALLVDLPGTLSLDPQSPDEALTRDLLVDKPGDGRPDAVVVVVSAVHLARGLYLVRQVAERGLRTMVALTMTDVAARRGLEVDHEALSRAIGVPVVVVDPRHGSGGDVLAAELAGLLAAPAPGLRAAAAAGCGDAHDDLAAAEARFSWVGDAVASATRRADGGRRPWTDRLDRVSTAPVVGPMLFLAVMWLVFQATTTVAAPLQSLLDELVSGPVSSAAASLLGAVGLAGTWVEGFVVDGLLAGVGMLLTFVPLMAVMFALLSLLEDSGYMARAAVVTDRAMRAIGLPGRAFLPLIVGFGCNVPAIVGTRVLPDARHRLLTSLLVPFTSCSARLTVYVLVATTFFGEHAGTVVFAMYVVSIVLVVLVGLLLRATLVRTVGDDPLVLDLPPYQLPLPRLVAAGTWRRLRGFLRTASGIIVASVVVVWALSATPAPGAPGSFGDVPVQDSVYASVAGTLAPVFDPAGFGSWESTSALMVGFVAKEAVVSSWAQTYATAEPSGPGDPGSLGEALRVSFERSSGGHALPAVLAFLVFLLAYTPCVATLSAQRREIGGRWTATGLVLQLVVAWLLAVAVFQVGRVFW